MRPFLAPVHVYLNRCCPQLALVARRGRFRSLAKNLESILFITAAANMQSQLQRKNPGRGITDIFQPVATQPMTCRCASRQGWRMTCHRQHKKPSHSQSLAGAPPACLRFARSMSYVRSETHLLMQGNHSKQCSQPQEPNGRRKKSTPQHTATTFARKPPRGYSTRAPWDS